MLQGWCYLHQNHRIRLKASNTLKKKSREWINFAQHCMIFSSYFRLLWPCIINIRWRERNQQDESNSKCHTVYTTRVAAPHNHSQHNQCRTTYAVVHSLVLLKMGIMMSETCWDRSLIINIRLFASCWFLSLHRMFFISYIKVVTKVHCCRKQKKNYKRKCI